MMGNSTADVSQGSHLLTSDAPFMLSSTPARFPFPLELSTQVAVLKSFCKSIASSF